MSWPRSIGCSRVTINGSTATARQGTAADHVLPAFVPPSINVPVVGGRLALGTWQSIALVDTNVDNERRTVRLTLVA